MGCRGVDYLAEYAVGHVENYINYAWIGNASEGPRRRWNGKWPRTPGQIRFRGDCDTPIIKGVVGLLVQLFSGLTPKQVLELDVDRLFERIRLGEHLSPNRHVGVYAIVDQMKAQAERLAGAPVAA